MQEVTLLETSPDLTVALAGEIDSKNAEEFYNTVISAYERERADLVFDCEKLSFIDSTTLGTFVKILNHVRTDGHGLRLVKLQPRLKKLFVICALDSIMEIE